jgi:hypothetical protein
VPKHRAETGTLLQRFQKVPVRIMKVDADGPKYCWPRYNGFKQSSEPLAAGDSCREGEERGEEVSVALVPESESAVAAEPGDGPFDGPAMC